MTEHKYAPDDNDLDWLAGRSSEPVLYPKKGQMEWRSHQSAKNPPKKNYNWIIAIIIAIVIILIAALASGNNWNPSTGSSGPIQGNCNDPSGLGC